MGTLSLEAEKGSEVGGVGRGKEKILEIRKERLNVDPHQNSIFKNRVLKHLEIEPSENH